MKMILGILGMLVLIVGLSGCTRGEEESFTSRQSVDRRKSVLTRWEDIKGETLRESCGLSKYGLDMEPEEVAVIKTAEDPIEVPTSPFISKEEYAQLGQTVGECGIAKFKLMSLLGVGLITQDHKAEINSLTLQCEHDKLRQMLNKT